MYSLCLPWNVPHSKGRGSTGQLQGGFVLAGGAALLCQGQKLVEQGDMAVRGGPGIFLLGF